MSIEKKSNPSLWAKMKKKVQDTSREGKSGSPKKKEDPKKSKKRSLTSLREQAKQYIGKAKKSHQKHKAKTIKKRKQLVKKARSIIRMLPKIK